MRFIAENCLGFVEYKARARGALSRLLQTFTTELSDLMHGKIVKSSHAGNDLIDGKDFRTTNMKDALLSQFTDAQTGPREVVGGDVAGLARREAPLARQPDGTFAVDWDQLAAALQADTRAFIDMLQAALAVPTAELAAAAAREGLKGPQIGERIEAARVAAMAQALPPAV